MTGTTAFDAIVIGGGLAGSSTAYHLTKLGARTLLVDRHHSGRATDAGAGILAPETSGLSLNDDWFTFAMHTGEHYPQLAAALRREQEGDIGYRAAAHLTVAVDEDEDEAFARAREKIYARQQARHAPSADRLHDVTSEEAQRLFPALAPTRGAVYFADAATVDGRLFTQALINAASQQGLTVHSGLADRLLIRDGRVEGVEADGVTYHAPRVVIAGGAWSPELAGPLNFHLPIEPQRGQIIHLSFPESVDTASWPIVTAFHGHYMLSWPDHRVTIGATRESGTGFEPTTTASGVLEVLREGLRVAPGLSQGSVKEIRVGLRPASPDHLPILGAIPTVAGVFVVTGHGASGLQLAPFSGKVVAEVATGQAPSADLTAFSAERFAQ